MRIAKAATMTNINLAQTYNSSTLMQNRIAPGTRGSFDIKIDTTGSEVGINYNVKFENENSKPQNLQYTYDGHIVSSIKELEPFLIGTIDLAKEVKDYFSKEKWKEVS